MKSIPKTNISFNLYHLPYITVPETCNFIKKETLAQVFACEFCEISKNTFFYRTPRGDCFCNKLNSISCGICSSFKSRHFELFCKITIQLFSTGIFLGLRSRQEVHLATLQEQLFFLDSHEWLLPII